MTIMTPDWVKDAVFYQIFPDRFAKGQSYSPLSFNVPYEPWEAAPTLQGYKGGNLWGVIEQLDYLQDLGINAIYFTPIFQSASNHRYHTHDYYQVDPILGGNLALEKLLDAAHQRGMKVVLDGVFNHASRGFFFFNDILENGPHSPWLDWFKVESWPLSAYDGSYPANYAGWVGNRALPEFNHDNPDVREYIMQVGEYWLKQGIDGWRLDVPFEIETSGFWQEFRQRVKGVNPEAYIVGEVWGDSRQWLDGSQFDGVMNYLFTGPTIAFCAGDRVLYDLVKGPDYYPYPPLDAQGYGEKIQSLLNLYPWEIQLTQLNLLSSHDTARLLSVAGEDKESLKLATFLLLTFPGAPSIYYGDEVGLAGKLDPDSRRGFPAPQQWDRDLLDYHKQLIALRHRYPALRRGDYQVIWAEGLCYGFARCLGDSKLLVLVNAGTESARAKFQSAGGFGQIVWGYPELKQEEVGPDTRFEVTLGARQGCVLVQQV
ncbi:glycoside hydrolase family 13 protein [Spirulina subsalsa]|uniref:glycoside hydrolase family 13 protein n=1 Tax=Spirulina subsalsa TaxID=54311 RepID=UPI0002E27558|nr:glycoside hydrolase family 13 protein [Spirulina subsalsa]